MDSRDLLLLVELSTILLLSPINRRNVPRRVFREVSTGGPDGVKGDATVEGIITWSAGICNGVTGYDIGLCCC